MQHFDGRDYTVLDANFILILCTAYSVILAVSLKVVSRPRMHVRNQNFTAIPPLAKQRRQSSLGGPNLTRHCKGGSS